MLQAPKQQEALRLKMMRDLYGPGLPACRQIETQILSKCGVLLLPLLCTPLNASMRSTRDAHTSWVCFLARACLSCPGCLSKHPPGASRAVHALLPLPVASARSTRQLTARGRRVQGGAPAWHALLQAGPAVADGRARHVRL